jgi:hypothetical protein
VPASHPPIDVVEGRTVARSATGEFDRRGSEPSDFEAGSAGMGDANAGGATGSPLDRQSLGSRPLNAARLNASRHIQKRIQSVGAERAVVTVETVA